MPKPPLVEDKDLQHAVDVARVTGTYGVRNAALLHVLFGTMMMPADPMPVIGFVTTNGRAPQVALIGMELDAWTNSHGSVCSVFRDGEKLGLKPGEFEVIAWHEQ